MKFSVCLVLLVTVWQASAQAPGDKDRRCLNDRANTGDVYPSNVTMLMDSRNYEELISGTSPHWQALDVDGTGNGVGVTRVLDVSIYSSLPIIIPKVVITLQNTWITWNSYWTSTLGGLCAYEARSCDYAQSASQNNWFFTQYISYLQAREVFVNFSATFTECRLNPSCNQLYVDMHRYQTNGRNDAAARTTSNYGQRIQRIQQPSGYAKRVYQTSFTFTPSGSFNGFYIGVRSTGTCVNIQRIQIYYRSFRPIVDLPVICPETGLPAVGTTATVTCSCPANSVATSSLQLTCRSDGTCTGNPSCRCQEGYQELSGQCGACPAGMYRSQSDPADSCLPCPANTVRSGVAVATCPCIAGHYRTAQEGPGVDCTAPPTAVRNLRVNSRTNTSITIQWDQPSVTGRSDYYYNVEYNDPTDISRYIQHNQERITSTNMYTVTGLLPVTTYIVRISVHNGVSGKDSQNDGERRREISDTTSEGVPSAPSSVQGLCTVVVWEEPSRTNGQLTGYDLRFYDASLNNMVNVSKRIFWIVRETDAPSSQRSSTYVQIRGRTGTGAGDWSEGVPLGCNDSAPTGTTTVGPPCTTNMGQTGPTGKTTMGQTELPGKTTTGQTGPTGTTTMGQGSSGFTVTPDSGVDGQDMNAPISGCVQMWYLGVAVAGSSLVTAIIVIIIVLVVVCICSRRKKEYEVEKTNGMNKNEFHNPMYPSK